MAKCKKCKEEFNPTIHNINYCRPCIRKSWAESSKETIVKSVGNRILKKTTNE